jgi:hypothetical protein
MKGSPSQYGGLAAAFVFGVGLLIVGFSLPVERHAQAISMRWGGALALAFGLFVLVISISGNRISTPLVVSAAAMICSVFLFYCAARSEITGEAVYHRNFLMRRNWRRELVTREAAPAEFRAATNARWVLSIVCALVSFGGFVVYRKTEYLDDF